MSMKKLSKKMLAVVAAGAMTMGLSMPAFAAEGSTTQDTTNNAKKAYISKVYNTEVGKAETFSFTATQITDGDDVVKTNHTVIIPEISFEATDLETTTKRVAVDCGSFNEAGKYSYTVKENAQAKPAVTNNDYVKLIMSKAEYKMDVYVVENTSGTFDIAKILVNKVKDDNDKVATGKVDIGDSDQNGFKFVNTYVQEAGTGEKPDPSNPDPNYKKNGALNVSKTVLQNVTDAEKQIPTEKFDFTVKFDFPAGTDKNTLGGVKGNNEDITIDENGTTSFQIAHNENMKFTGLPVGTKITVTEAAKANYKASAKVTLNGVVQTPAVAASKYNAPLTAVNGDKLLGQKTNTVDVTNRYNNVPTTGIIMNTLPYVLMIALCGAALFGFVAFKRRR